MRSFCSYNLHVHDVNTFGVHHGKTMAFDAGDKTDRFIAAARARAHAALQEEVPKLTALEKGMLESMRRGGRPVRDHRPVK